MSACGADYVLLMNEASLHQGECRSLVYPPPCFKQGFISAIITALKKQKNKEETQKQMSDVSTLVLFGQWRLEFM